MNEYAELVMDTIWDAGNATVMEIDGRLEEIVNLEGVRTLVRNSPDREAARRFGLWFEAKYGHKVLGWNE